jgi:hypothetical protein
MTGKIPCIKIDERTSSPSYFVGEHHFWWSDGQIEERRNSFVIRDLSAGQDKVKRASLTVCTGVDFRRKAAASTKTLLMSPPLAPAACEWPRIVVVSIMCVARQKS